MNDPCINHPELPAIERCETCGDPLCGLCLWYDDEGRRFCETHAKSVKLADGKTVFAPETYAEGVSGSLIASRIDASENQREAKYHANQQDLTAFLAAILGVVTITACFGGIYCMPIVAVVLGAIAYSKADLSVDPKRTRNFALAGMITGGLLLVGIIVIIMLYGAVIVAAISGAGSSFP